MLGIIVLFGANLDSPVVTRWGFGGSAMRESSKVISMLFPMSCTIAGTLPLLDEHWAAMLGTRSAEIKMDVIAVPGLRL